jgi:hypothetical protein
MSPLPVPSDLYYIRPGIKARAGVRGTSAESASITNRGIDYIMGLKYRGRETEISKKIRQIQEWGVQALVEFEAGPK